MNILKHLRVFYLILPSKYFFSINIWLALRNLAIMYYLVMMVTGQLTFPLPLKPNLENIYSFLKHLATSFLPPFSFRFKIGVTYDLHSNHIHKINQCIYNKYETPTGTV